MHKGWNPKFGFFLPCEKHLKNNSISKIQYQAYPSLLGPFPLDEFCSNKEPIADRLDRFVDFINNKNKPCGNLDVIVLCDYSCTYHARNFFITHARDPELQNIQKALIQTTIIIESNTNKNRRYVSPPVGSHYFTTELTSLRE